MVAGEPVPVTEARAQLSELVGRVAFGGQRIPLSRHGRIRAALVSADDLARLEELDAAGLSIGGGGQVTTAPSYTRAARPLAPAAHLQPPGGAPRG